MTKIKQALAFWPVVVLIGSVVFGYGVLNQRVVALEKSDQTKSEKIDNIDKNVVNVLNKVSFIEGQLSSPKKQGN